MSDRGEVKINMSEISQWGYTHSHRHTPSQTVNEVQHCREIAVSEETCCVEFHLLLTG